MFRDGSIREAACHTNARKKFYDIHVSTSLGTTQNALEYIGGLCNIKASIRGRPAAEWLRIGHEKARPPLQFYEAWLRAKLETVSSKSDTTKAINYTLNQWSALTLYCEDGTREIDNNIAKSALSRVRLSQKNFLFAALDSGGERAAAMHALIATCTLNDIDPRGYLDCVLTHIAGHKVNCIRELQPWRVAKKLHTPGSPSESATSLATPVHNHAMSRG